MLLSERLHVPASRESQGRGFVFPYPFLRLLEFVRIHRPAISDLSLLDAAGLGREPRAVALLLQAEFREHRGGVGRAEERAALGAPGVQIRAADEQPRALHRYEEANDAA